MAAAENNWSSDYRPKETTSLRVISKPVDGAGAEAKIIQGCRIEGSVELVGCMQIDGEIDGDLVSTGEIIIGETGVINANIITGKIKVYGQVYGDIIAEERIEFCAGACVKGDIKSPKVVMQDGVVFQGHCIMPAPESNNLATREQSAQREVYQQQGDDEHVPARQAEIFENDVVWKREQ